MATKTTCYCDRCGCEIPPPESDEFMGKFLNRKAEVKPTILCRIGVYWPFTCNLPVQYKESEHMLCERCDAEFVEWMEG